MASFLLIPEVAEIDGRCVGCDRDKCDGQLESSLVVQQCLVMAELNDGPDPERVAREQIDPVSHLRTIGCTHPDESIINLVAEVCGNHDLQKLANALLGSTLLPPEE